MGIKLQTWTVVAEDSSLRWVRLTRRKHRKKNLNVAQIKFFTFVVNFLQLKKKAIIKFLKAEFSR